MPPANPARGLRFEESPRTCTICPESRLLGDADRRLASANGNGPVARMNRFLSVVLAVAVTALCLWFLLTPDVLQSLRRIGTDAKPLPIVGAFLLCTLVQWLRAWRYSMMTAANLDLPPQLHGAHRLPGQLPQLRAAVSAGRTRLSRAHAAPLRHPLPACHRRAAAGPAVRSGGGWVHLSGVGVGARHGARRPQSAGGGQRGGAGDSTVRRGRGGAGVAPVSGAVALRRGRPLPSR